MTDLTDKEQLAAEYVIGTLTHEERERVRSACISDTELQFLVDVWQQRLSPLLETIPEATPREELLGMIEKRLPTQAVATVSNVTVIHLRTQLQRWRKLALASSVLAASLAAFILFFSPASNIHEPFVAVFQQDDQQPAFLMSVNLKTRQLIVRPVSAEGRLGKTYQLWIKADALGDKPRSLGLVDSLSEPTFKQVEFDETILKEALFGISIEPEGGSPTGQPTGPAIHGRLYPASI